jgi:DNA-binding FrmR family transcriptional regulator
MEMDGETRKSILARLRRAEGQVRGVHAMIEEGRDCTDVVTQFAAAIKALEQAGYKYFAATLTECAINPDEAEANGYTAARLEKMFMQLA